MTEAAVLTRIHEDLEFLKVGITEIRAVIGLEPEIREEIKERVKEARKRIAKGEFVSNKEILKEFDIE